MLIHQDSANALRARIVLDGEDITDLCVLADDEQGYVFCLIRHTSLNCVLFGPDVGLNNVGVLLERREGKVEIFLDGVKAEEVPFRKDQLYFMVLPDGHEIKVWIDGAYLRPPTVEYTGRVFSREETARIRGEAERYP